MKHLTYQDNEMIIKGQFGDVFAKINREEDTVLIQQDSDVVLITIEQFESIMEMYEDV